MIEIAPERVLVVRGTVAPERLVGSLERVQSADLVLGVDDDRLVVLKDRFGIFGDAHAGWSVGWNIEGQTRRAENG